MGEETLEHAMRTCIEGPERLTDETLEEIIENYKKSQEKKNSTVINNYLFSLVHCNMLFNKAKSALEVNFFPQKILDRTLTGVFMDITVQQDHIQNK